MKNKFVIVTHAVFSDERDIAGPAHNIVSYLNKKNVDYLFIRHSLFGEGKSLITISSKDVNKNINLSSQQSNEIINRLVEGYRTLRYCFYFLKGDKCVYIGVDPLNSLWGFLLKKLGKVNKLITFSADYSVKRYGNKFFNALYYFIDNITINNSDYVWSVSKRIKDLRTSHGINKGKLFYIPNSPPFSQLKKLIKENPDSSNLITIATISKAIDFTPVLDGVSELRKRKNIKLTIIGGGAGLSQLKKEVLRRKLGKSIVFMGPKSHEEVFRILSENGIGIALYTDEASWSFYSDSMKARDYLALGLPVIFSGDIGTGYEIKKENAGILIERNKDELVKAIKKLIENKNYYNTLRTNALKLAKKNDIEYILDNALKDL